MLIERSLYSHWADKDIVRQNRWMHKVIAACENDPSKKNWQKFREMDTLTFRFWENVARAHSLNMIWVMLDKNSLMLMDKMLIRSMHNNVYYWTDEKLETVIGYCEACVRMGKREVREIQELLEIEKQQRVEEMARTAKKPKQPKPQKQEKSSKKAEKAAKTPAQPVIRDNQPGTANKFTEDAPASRSGSQSAYSNGYTNVSASRPQPGNDENIDALMGIMGTTQNRPAPQEETYYYSENVPNPLLNPEETDKPAKRNLFDIFVNKKRRS